MILFFISFICLNSQVFAGDYTKGLYFNSHQVNKDERTSLDLLPDKGLKLEGGFAIEFEVKLERHFHNYGYILRVISSSSQSLDILSNSVERWLKLIFNNSKGETFAATLVYDENQVLNDWETLKVQINTEEAFLFFNEKQVSVKSDFEKFSKHIEHVYFGANKHKIFYTTDVPPMTVRNIVIRDKKEAVLRNWDMGKHAKNATYDLVGNYKADVLNAIWLIDRHSKWKKEMELNLKTRYAQIAIDSVRNRVIVAAENDLYVLHLNNKEIHHVKPNEGRPYLGASSYLIYDYRRDRLISYNNLQNQLIFYDFEENKWINSDIIDFQIPLYIQHHNRFIDQELDQLVLFGGYGHYSYKANLYKHYLDEGDWTVVDMKENVTPRYLASMAYLGNGEMLIFGGYGSKSGIQEASPFNISDLVKINTRDNTSKVIGSFEDLNEPQTYSNSMVLAPDKAKLYTLAYRNDLYQSSIRLLELDTHKLTHRYISDSIPYNFQDTESYCDLYLYDASMLYAVILQKRDDQFNVSIYSLYFPPLTLNEISQIKIKEEPGVFSILLICVIITVIALLIFSIYANRNRNKGKSTDAVEVRQEKESKLNEDAHLISTIQRETRKSWISLLGGFQVFDKEGLNITGQFTPIIRQMFLYCLLKFIDSGKGVTSENLEELLWFDLDKAKAVNNRNVNIRKLRILLDKVGDISFQKTNMYWQVYMGKDVYCDYISILLLLDMVKREETVSLDMLDKILEVASAGILLPNLDEEWLDTYKSSYSALLISVLVDISKQENMQKDIQRLMRIADVILVHDNLDEYSIKIKCRCLYLQGQKGMSKQFYDKFCEDYRSILNEDPKLSYASIISGEAFSQ